MPGNLKNLRFTLNTTNDTKKAMLLFPGGKIIAQCTKVLKFVNLILIGHLIQES